MSTPSPSRRGARNRYRAIALARRREPQNWLPWLAFALLLLAAVAAHAQQPDTGTAPRGSESGALQRSNGVITPPASVDPGMPVARPNTDAFPTPNVRPPAPSGNAKVVPK
jgi:hypothetical protein